MALVDNAFYVNYGNGSSTGYYAITPWAASTTKIAGALIRQNAAPTVGNERTFVCIASTGGTGQTGGSEPTWTVTRGAKNTDNTVTWQEATGIAALNGDLTNTPTWTTVKNTAVTLGQVITNVAKTIVLICTTAGTAGNAAEPTWAAFTNAGATTADNTVTWTNIGAVGNFSAGNSLHNRIANALTATWGQAGNKLFVGDTHAETQSTALNLTGPGTSAKPVLIICADHTKAPPGSGDLKTSATVTSTANAQSGLDGSFYVYGITFQVNGSSSASIIVGQNPVWQRYENCGISATSTNAASPLIRFGDPTGEPSPRVEWINSTFGPFGAVGNWITLGVVDFIWKNNAAGVGILGSTFPTNLFNGFASSQSCANVLIEGVDLSGLGSGKNIFGAAGHCGEYVLKDCKLGASVTINGAPTNPTVTIDVIRCDSGATNNRTERHQYQGDLTTETGVVRVGGASDGTNQVSWKVITTANSQWVMPFQVIPIMIWNPTTAANVTVTIEGTWNQASVPNNDDIWMDVEYLGSSASPLASFATTTKSNVQATGSAATTSVSSWLGGGSGAGWSPFKMQVTLSSPQPGQAGYIFAYIKVAKASSTIYIDPKITLS